MSSQSQALTAGAQVSAREAYRAHLLQRARSDARIYCLDSDMGGLEDGFGAELPGQYVDLGIAEANMMTVAAALASAGKIPFVNTMAGFASARACEQVKIDVAYNNLPVKIVASHAGVSAGHLGPTHHALEDLAIMRAFPNMTVIVPADAAETVAAIDAAIGLPGPVYVRLGRKATAPVYEDGTDLGDLAGGRAVTLRSGEDVTLVAAGAHPVLAALEAHERLAAEGTRARVINARSLKPLDADALVAAAAETHGLVTVEEHNVIGGLGGAVCELLSERLPAPVRRVGFADVFCERVGAPPHLLEAYGIAAEPVVEAARELLAGVRPGGGTGHEGKGGDGRVPVS